jgi:hypothetical protein
MVAGRRHRRATPLLPVPWPDAFMLHRKNFRAYNAEATFAVQRFWYG